MPTNRIHSTRVRKARRNSTPAERKLWSRSAPAAAERRQVPAQVWLGPFIADFFCAEARLIVEVDGDSHADQVDYDQRRTRWLASEGFRLVRVTNADVMHNLDGVLEHIASALPSPSQP